MINNSNNLYIGIDVGTGGCRGVAIDDAGRVRATAQRSLAAPVRADNGSEQDPGLWWRALVEVVTELRKRLDSPIAALAIDATSATVLLCDDQGVPAGPALMYDDSRAVDQAQTVAERAPPDSAARGASSSLAKVLYLQRRHPQARRALHQADWLTGRLLGRFGLSDENNALKLGYDPVAQQWPAWLSGFAGLGEMLPKPIPPGTVLGPAAGADATALGLDPQTRIVAGTTDSTAAFLATGAHRTGDAVTSLGSTLVLKVLADQPVFAPEFGVYSHRLQDRWLVGGASNSGGAVLLEYFTPEQMQQLTPLLDPGRPTGLDYYPLRRPGERFPVADPDLAPRLTPRPPEPERFFQALLEGLTEIEGRGYELLARLGAPYPTSVRSVGGGAVNSVWTALRTARLGVPMIEPAHQEACYGAALLARAGALGKGIWESVANP